MNPQQAFQKAYDDREALGKELGQIELGIDAQKIKLSDARSKYRTLDKIVKASAAEMAKSTVIKRGRPPGSGNKKVVTPAPVTITKADLLKQVPKKAAKKARA